MDLSQLANLGEFIGGVAVLVTLVYLALQVRQGNSIERARANREVTREANQIYMEMREPQFMRVLRRASVDYDSLSNNDKSLVTYRFLAPLAAHATSTFLASRDRLVDPSYAYRWMNNWVSIVRSPGFGRWWEAVKAYLEPEFVDEVDRIRASPEGPPPLHEGVPCIALDHYDQEAD